MAMRLSVRAPVSRPAAVRSVRSVSSRVPARRVLPIVFSNSADVSQKIESAVKEAKETCETGTTADCAVAWDTVEELSAEAKRKKEVEAANSDPLEKYCEGNPEADECRVYED